MWKKFFFHTSSFSFDPHTRISLGYRYFQFLLLPCEVFPPPPSAKTTRYVSVVQEINLSVIIVYFVRFLAAPFLPCSLFLLTALAPSSNQGGSQPSSSFFLLLSLFPPIRAPGIFLLLLLPATEASLCLCVQEYSIASIKRKGGEKKKEEEEGGHHLLFPRAAQFLFFFPPPETQLESSLGGICQAAKNLFSLLLTTSLDLFQSAVMCSDYFLLRLYR